MNMSKREVISALLDKQIPDRMGLHEHFWPFIRENSWNEQGLDPDADFSTEFNLDLKGVLGYSAPGPRPDLEAVLEETDEWSVKRDAWGAITKYWKHKAGTPEHVGFTMDDPDVWFDEFKDAFLAVDFKSIIDVEQGRAELKKGREQGYFSTFSFMFIFEWMRKVMGDVCMLESLLIEKDFVHDFNRTMTDHYIKAFEYIFDQVGLPDGIHFYEDLGYTNAAFASPACHLEMIQPYHIELVQFLKSYNLPVIMHTCGDFRVHLPAIVETGVDCIQTLEAKTGMDVATLAKDWGDKLCFMGNLDIRAYESGDRKKIKEEVVGKMEAMKKLRAPYIVMSDHSISPSVHIDDYRYSLDLYKEHCLYN